METVEYIFHKLLSHNWLSNISTEYAMHTYNAPHLVGIFFWNVSQVFKLAINPSKDFRILCNASVFPYISICSDFCWLVKDRYIGYKLNLFYVLVDIDEIGKQFLVQRSREKQA